MATRSLREARRHSIRSEQQKVLILPGAHTELGDSRAGRPAGKWDTVDLQVDSTADKRKMQIDLLEQQSSTVLGHGSCCRWIRFGSQKPISTGNVANDGSRLPQAAKLREEALTKTNILPATGAEADAELSVVPPIRSFPETGSCSCLASTAASCTLLLTGSGVRHRDAKPCSGQDRRAELWCRGSWVEQMTLLWAGKEECAFF